jgi:LPS-assembly lipoprotein
MAARLRGLVIAGLLSACAGCAGLTPLYAEPKVGQGLHAISIDTPRSRTGFLLREQLQDELAPSTTEAPRYHLAVTMIERRRPRGLNQDDTPTRYETRLDLSYTLSDTSGNVLLKRSRPVFVSVNAVYQPYATIVTQDDSEERVAREAAQIIRTDVALALAQSK